MMLLPYLITIIAFMGLVRASPTAAIEEKDTELAKRDNRKCQSEGIVYSHGQVFSQINVPCIKYRCMFGSISLYREGCKAFDNCWRVGTQFRHQCRDYRCETFFLGHITEYVAKAISPRMCKDVYGNCKRPGEMFPYKINNVFMENCRCSMDGESIQYYCTSTVG